MKRNIILIGIIAVFMIAITSCRKVEGPQGALGAAGTTGGDGAKGDAGIPGPFLTGSIIGLVELVDGAYDGDPRILPDQSGVTVTVEGTNPLKTTTTAANGKYQIDGLPTGTYTITFSKTGFGTYKAIGVPFVGGSKTWMSEKLTLFPAIPDATISNFKVINNSGSLYASGSISLNATAIRFFLSKSPSVSSTNYESTTTQWAINNDDVSNTGTFENVYFTSDANYNGYNTSLYPAGTTVYIVAYGTTAQDDYFDGRNGMNTYKGDNGLTVYPAIGTAPSNTVFVVSSDDWGKK